MHTQAEALARLIADYRGGEIARPTAEHVERWVSQFDADERLPILEELHHVWSKLYFSKQAARAFLRKVITSTNLTGGDPAAFWGKVSPLDIQARGHSQHEMLKLFADELRQAAKIDLSTTGVGPEFVYLDDVLFTGSRIQHDLKAWLPSAPDTGRVHILLLAFHRFGQYATDKALQEEAQRLEKAITFKFWYAFELENRKSERRNADVLWPTHLPPEAANYNQGKFPLEPRPSGGRSQFFSSDARRTVLEHAFLKAGLRIRSFSSRPSTVLRPLGFSPFGVGFGSLFLSFRNCPNNAPLALWWGDPNRPSWHPFSRWYPLVPRKTYGTDGAD